MIFYQWLLITHNHDSTSSITRVLHTATWDFFTLRLPGHFCSSPKVVKEAIMTDLDNFMTDLDNLVQEEFWRTSSDRDVGYVGFAMCRLYDILHRCSNILEVGF